MADGPNLDIIKLREDLLGNDPYRGDLAPGTSVEELSIDAVTGLLPRSIYRLMMEQQFALAKRTKVSFAIAMFDVDDFKSINDTYGHAIGDEVLKQLGESSRRIFRTTDIIGRYGGDEIIVMMPNLKLDEDKLTKLEMERAERLAQQVDITSPDGKTIIEISVSLGIAVWRVGSEELLGDVIKRADNRLYQIKDEKRKKRHGQ